jgi:PAS domain S-box-containing protein
MPDDVGIAFAVARVFGDSRDPEKAIVSLVRMAVPAVADVCAIQTLDENHNLSCLTLARIDAEAEDGVSVVQRRPSEGEKRSASHAALLEELAAESNLVLPLASRGGVLGTAAFGLSQPGGFWPDQIRWIEDFARGVSLGMENARLARMAERLERDREIAQAARARAEAALSSGESVLRMLVEHHQDRTCILEVGPDRTYRLCMASPSLLEAADLSSREWKGRLLRDLLPAGIADLYRRACDQILEAGLPVEMETESVFAPGGWEHTLYTPIRDDAGGITHIVASARDVTSRKKAEQEAATMRDVLRASLNAIEDGIFVMGPDGRPVFANAAAARLARFPSLDAYLAAAPEDLRARIRAEDEDGNPLPHQDFPGLKALRTGENQSALIRLRGLEDEDAIWLETKASCLNGADGKPRLVVSCSRDVTALKENENSLRKSRAEAREARGLIDAALNALQEAILVCDAEGRIRYVNEAASRFLGHEAPEGLTGLPLAQADARVEALDEGGRPIPESERPLARILRGQGASSVRILQLRGRQDGRIRWVEHKAVAIPDEDGAVRHVAAAMIDITRLKIAQDAVAVHEERLRLTLDVGRVGVWEVDLRTGLLTWSDRMSAMHGRGPGQAPRTQAEFLALIHTDDRPHVMAAFLAADSRDHFEIEYRVPARQGGHRWFHSRGGYQRAPDGRALRFMGATIEITERKRSQQAAIHMQDKVRRVKHMESIGRMAGGMSHDFNNLLTAINGYAELILESAREDRVLSGYASNIRESGERALRITQQLLAFSERQLLETEVADVNGIVGYMAGLVRKLADDSVLVTPLLSPTPEPIRADTGKLKQALMNVIMNALDAMPQGGRITLTTFYTRLQEGMEAHERTIPPGNYVVIEVADTGVGIEPETLARIFEPYFTTKPIGLKSGLGLAMVLGIVKQHGGYVHVTSEVGVGTRFRMYFPPADLASGAPRGNSGAP